MPQYIAVFGLKYIIAGLLSIENRNILQNFIEMDFCIFRIAGQVAGPVLLDRLSAFVAETVFFYAVKMEKPKKEYR